MQILRVHILRYFKLDSWSIQHRSYGVVDDQLNEQYNFDSKFCRDHFSSFSFTLDMGTNLEVRLERKVLNSDVIDFNHHSRSVPLIASLHPACIIGLDWIHVW